MNEDRTIDWRLQVTGSAETANALDKTAEKLGKVSDSTRQLSDESSKTGKASEDLNRRFTGIASTASALGMALSRISPTLGGLVQSVGSAGGAISGLSRAIGGGVGGLIGGGLIAALGMASRFIADYREEQEKAEKATKLVTEATWDYASALAEVKKEKELGEYERKGKAGKLELEQYEADLIMTRQAMRKAQARLGQLEPETPEFAYMQSEYLRYSQQEAEIRANKQIAIMEAGYKTESERIDAEAKRLEELYGIGPTPGRGGRGRREKVMEPGAAVAGMGKAGGGAEWYMMEPGKSELLSEEEAFASKKVEIAKQANEQIKESNKDLLEQELADRREVAQAWFEFAATGPKAALNALYDLAKGYKLNAEKMIESIGDTLWSSGLSHVLQAAAYAFIPGMQGPSAGLATAGAAEMATGLVMGAAGARAGGAGGNAPARPEPITGSYRGNEGGGGTFVINVQTLTPTYEAGMAVVDSMNMAQQRRGSTAVPSWGR